MVTQADLDEFLRGQPAGTGVDVKLGDGAASVRVTRLGPEIEARVQLTPSTSDRPFALAVGRVRVAGLPVPDVLADWIVRQFDPTLALRRLPAAVSLPEIRIQSGRIEIGHPR